MRNRLVLGVVGLLMAVGCDDRKDAPLDGVEVPPATQAAAPESASPTTGPAKSIPLGVIPFRAEAPPSWAVASGLGNRIVLHATLPSGEVDVLLSTQQPLNPDTFKDFIAGVKRPATQQSHAETQVLTRDNLTIVETIDRPIAGLVTYNVKYFVTAASLEIPVYELSIGDLTQEMYEKDGEAIRKVLLGLTYDPAATGPGAADPGATETPR